MTPTTKRAPRTRDLQLSLAAMLAFASWLSLLAFFIGFPVIYLLKIPVTVPILAGAVGLVAVLFILYYLLAGSLHCQVCGCPVFGGGEGHRKHPHSRKFLGISYSRQVAAEILSMRGFHCMHCQTFCRSRRKSQRLPDELAGIVPGTLAGQMFQNPASSSQEPTTPADALFENIFKPITASPPPPPMSHPREIAHPERTPWSHHPAATPFIQPETMNTPAAPLVAAAPMPLIPQTTPVASPFSILVPPPPAPAPVATPVNIAAPPPVFPLTVPHAAPEALLPAAIAPALPVTSPFEVLTQAMAPKPQAPLGAPLPPLEKSPAPQILKTIVPEMAMPPVLPPPPAPIAAPAPPIVPAPAPAPPTADLHQVVTEVTILIEQTRQSLNQLFSEMVSQLKIAVTPAPAAIPVAPPILVEAPLEIPAAPPAPLPVAVIAPQIPEPTPPPAPVKPALTALEITDLTEDNPPPPVSKPAATQPPAVVNPVAPAVDASKAAALNEMLARAFSQRQSSPPVSAPAPAPILSPAPSAPPPQTTEQLPLPRPVQSPFQVLKELDSPLDNPMAAFPFPPLPEDFATPQQAFSGIPPLPPPWDHQNADTEHPAPFTFLSKPENAAPETPKPSPEWTLPPLKHAPPAPINWPTPNGKV